MTREDPAVPGAARSDGPLSGLTIALPETRELDRLASLLEGDGATTMRCPMVAILDAPDPAPIDIWLQQLVAGAFDDLIFLTGEGLRRLTTRARTLGIEPAFVAALGNARKITRGGKPVRALKELGLSTDMPAAVPTSEGLMTMLGPLDLRGRRVGLQLYGTEPNEPLVRFLAGAGATVHTVAPYIYAPASDDTKVAQLIRDLEAGHIHAIAFTSASQVDRLWNVARAHNVEEALRTGLGRSKVAAVGPVVAEALVDRGIRVDVEPGHPFVLRNLTNAIVAAFGRPPVAP